MAASGGGVKNRLIVVPRKGARGLKYCNLHIVHRIIGRAPQGVRGLKLPSTMGAESKPPASCSARGTMVCCPIYKKAVLFQSMWIEMAAGLRGGMLRKEARGLEFGVDKRSRKED